MSFLDKLNQTLNKAGEKANDMAATAKTKMDISKHTSSINTKYQKLGEVVYKSEKEGTVITEEVLTFVNEIDLLFEEIAKLNVQLAEINAAKPEAPQGVPMQDQVSAAATIIPDGKECPTCGKINESAAVFCAGCGTKIG